ncbi:MAG: CopG family transcriptional regulator [Campylobacterota bacterium]|nr:CopG family transcriptional regulator [Campylobacterota bacterium]
MSQVTIYINNQLEEKIKKIAQSMNVSISKFIVSAVEQQLKEEWPNSIKKLSGSWSDFPNEKEIRQTKVDDMKREDF